MQFIASSAQARRMRAGDPFLEETTVGGTISPEHAQKVAGRLVQCW
jgi:acyl-CoA reductase-like NAD-dependent aldehyde dehydrogenase